MGLMQTRFDEIEKKMGDINKQSPCTIQLQRIEDECSQKVSQLEQEQLQINSKLKASEQQRSELVESKESLLDMNTSLFLQQSADKMRIDQLKSANKALKEEVSRLGVLAAPAAKKLAAQQAEAEKKRRAAQLLQESAGLYSIPVSDQYQMKRTKPR